MDKPKPFTGQSYPRQGSSFCVSLSKSDAAEVRNRILACGLNGPSHFFQRLISEGRGAKLPVMGGKT